MIVKFIFITVVFIFLLAIVQDSKGGQECLSCSGVEGPHSCEHRIQCPGNEVCYMHHYKTESGSLGFDYGCALPQTCMNTVNVGFGRRSEGHHVLCSLCCDNSKLCNEDLNCSSTQQVSSYLPRECSDLKLSSKVSGVYTIYPYGKQLPAVPVFCKLDSSGHMWTVIQSRWNGSINFYRNWQAYKNGFGHPNGEYWLGNDIIHELTSDANHALLIEMTDFNDVTKFAEYLTFHVSNEQNGYRLLIDKYDGTAGDSLTYHKGQKFTTMDRDNDNNSNNCAVLYTGAWWHKSCYNSNLNGLYNGTGNKGIVWEGFHKAYSLKSTLMMIRKY